ncbi:pentapeptide repeat-containing protein [Paenibacillus sp. V4I5]|uniref:pentapeptide repeat-containing protein n=1 Tax=Paenibacillus sp. V4I5 TaxID=3042306 RepID=UPI002792942A|nr:pentapeptide repeat-containing protein [Paenibacillus sp. V4I5]MDQ0917027.1 uncharacterized protein YjbI with pentapeptide repeats [Paenibacillus sp. V4I5]
MERDITEAEFIDMLQNGQRSFHRIYVEAGAYHGFDFSDLTFEVCLFSVDFSGSKFENTRFINSNLKACDFSNCLFTNAILIGNALDGANFKGAIVNGVTFIENTYHSIVLTEHHLTEMIL